MPLRDPTAIQLDFPLLTADLIAQLNLIGSVGLLNFDPVVRPVFIVGDRDLSVDASPTVFKSTELFHGFGVAPAANTTIIGTGALPAGEYDVFAEISAAGVAAGQAHVEFQHRNAANTVTLAILADVPLHNTIQVTSSRLPQIGYTLAANELLRIQVLLFNFTGPLSGVIGARLRSTP